MTHAPARNTAWTQRLTAASFGPALKQQLANTMLTGVRMSLSPHLSPPSEDRDFTLPAVVAAYGRGTGISQGARLQHAALLSCQMDATMVDATAALRNPLVRTTHRLSTSYIFHCGAPQTASLMRATLPHVSRARRVAYWAWELPDPPLEWRPNEALVSEIWTPSRFSAHSLASLFSIPVRVVPHRLPVHTPRTRRDGPFTVLVMADARSSLARKNPYGAVEAFSRAFGDCKDAALVVKLTGHGPVADALAETLGRMPNAHCIRSYLDEAELAALYRSTDAFVSTHRAEGFGLPILEAMGHGIPAIATGWSGNLDFMSNADSVLLPYALVPVKDPQGIYSGSRWAEPDIDAAAEALRWLRDDRAAYNSLAERAYQAAVRAADTNRFRTSIIDPHTELGPM